MRAMPKEIARLTGLHPHTIRNWADKGIIQCTRDFRGWRWFPEPLKTVREIQRLLNGETVPKKKEPATKTMARVGKKDA